MTATATMNPKSHASNYQPDTCAACGAQLAVLAGVLTRGTDPAEIIPRDGAGNVADADLERHDGKITDRARRKMYVGCGACRRPVPADHPRQRKLDSDWAERDKQDSLARERAAKIPPSPSPVYTEEMALEKLARLEKSAATQAARIETLEAGIAALKQALAQAKHSAKPR